MSTDTAPPIVPSPDVGVRIDAANAAAYLGVGVGIIHDMFKAGAFPSVTYVAGKQHKVLLSEVRGARTHAFILEAQERRQARKAGRVRKVAATTKHKREAQRLDDVEALMQEHHRILTQLGVTVTYRDLDKPPEDAVGERHSRPGMACPGYRKAPPCGGKIRLVWSGVPGDKTTALNGWFLGCSGHKHDHSGCEFSETIVRSKTSGTATVLAFPAVAGPAPIVPVPITPTPGETAAALPHGTPPDNSGAPTTGG